VVENRVLLPSPVAAPRVRHVPWRKMFQIVRLAAVLAGAAFWFVALRPQSLGGPADYVMVAGTSMLPTLKTGDVVVVRPQAEYRPGDIIAYRVPKGAPAAGGRIIHRVVSGSGASGYTVKGDNRKSADLWHPKDADVIGTVWVRLPYAARFAQLLRSPLVLASLAAGLIFAFVVGSGRVEEKHPNT
jgi:signal peptidase I